jgi:trimeric autotransporter adhesin
LDRQEVRLRVEDAGARYPVVVDPFFLVATLTASNGTPGNENFFGDSISASSDGSTIAVGAISADIDAGAVYVFVRGEDSIAELCRKEGINQNLYYH